MGHLPGGKAGFSGVLQGERRREIGMTKRGFAFFGGHRDKLQRGSEVMKLAMNLGALTKGRACMTTQNVDLGQIK